MAFFTVMDTTRGRKRFLHCAANKRASAFLGLYRALREGWALEPAFAPMHEIWTPDPIWSDFIDRMLTLKATDLGVSAP